MDIRKKRDVSRRSQLRLHHFHLQYRIQHLIAAEPEPRCRRRSQCLLVADFVAEVI